MTLAAAIGGGGLASPAMAATFKVGTATDLTGSCQAPASGTCSLRQLINFENGLATSNPGDTVVVPAGTYSLTAGELGIDHSMSIAGAGARVTDVDQVSQGGGRVFDIGIPEGGFIPKVVISGLQVSHGSITFFAGTTPDTGFGANVRNLGTLTLDNDWITAGVVNAGSGGGISNEGGTLTVANSLVSGNVSNFVSNSGGDSGGIQNFGPNPITQTPGHLSIVNSTIANNTSALGGGVYSWCGGGGGPCSPTGAVNTTSIVNSTIAHNDGGTRGTIGGGLLVGQGTVSIQNSIVAFNTVDSPAAGRPSNCGATTGVITSAGHNLDSGTDCHFHAAGDISGTDPGFTSSGPRNNGGDTDTLGLSATSPAVDAIVPGTSGCGGTDQRGTSRPQGSGCEIGAYELFEPQEGRGFSTQVAVTPLSPTGPITIAWGDRTTSTGTLASGASGPILGAHTYASAGIYNGAVTWRDNKGNESATFSMKVTDAPLNATGLAIAARVGTPFSGPVATFADPNPFATPADFSVTVNWGDGTTSAGNVTTGAGNFVVSATHTYASPATYQTTIAIHDIGGASAQAGGVATVIVVHSTSTFVGCSPTSVTPGHATTCTATVNDDGPGAATTPTGTISFSSGRGSKLSGGGQCNLSGSGGSASCSVSFTPGQTQSDTPTLTAGYGGDFGHTGSSGSTTVAPVAGMTANVAVVQGTVLISLPRHAPRAGAQGPSSASYVPLKGMNTIPVGSTIDATHGTVRLATAADYHGALDRRHRIQTGIFSAAIFTIEQQTAKQKELHSHRKATGVPPTNLRLLTAPATTAASLCRAKASKAIVRELSARANGFYRVIAAASVTIVRNAQWTVEDRCDGTLTGVGRGTAKVTFLLHHRPVSKVVRAGRGLLVRQRFPIPRPPITAKGIPLPPGV